MATGIYAQTTRRVKQFAIYCRSFFIDEMGNVQKVTSTIGDAGPSTSILSCGTGEDHWQLMGEYESVIDALDRVEGLLEEGHAIEDILFTRKIPAQQILRV